MKLTKEQVVAIPQLIAKGMQCKEIAKLYGVTPTAIAYWVRRHRKDGKEIKIKRGITLDHDTK